MKFNIVYDRSFIAWLTVITPLYVDGIIAGMVKKGYTVGAAASDNALYIGRKDSPGVVISLLITTRAETIDAPKIHKDLIEVCDELKVLSYSIIVSAMTDCSWSSSNINLPKAAKPNPPPVPKTNKSNLN